jgi:SAM-dependent methyltransferase
VFSFEEKPPNNKTLKLPLTFEEIVAEIVHFTDIPQKEVEYRVWMQALEPGWNILNDVKNYQVTPHLFDDNMIRLYQEGDGFIFETLVFWAKSFRYQCTQHALKRIELHAKSEDRSPNELRILIFGDGTGNDSLFFASNSLNIYYYDIPGSKTYDFATQRFDYYGYLGRSIHPLPDYSSCFTQPYDVVITFDVLEHLQEPKKVITDVGSIIRTGGIALITEDFEDIIDRLPTHLQKNTRYIGKLPFLLLKNNMKLTWYNREYLFKPMEYKKVDRLTNMDRLNLFIDPMIRGTVISKYLKHFIRVFEKAPYYGG